MGLSISLLTLAWVEVLINKFSGFLEEIKDAVKINGYNQEDVAVTLKTTNFKRSYSDCNKRSSISNNTTKEEFKRLDDGNIQHERNTMCMSPRPKSELDAAAVKLQKVYKSYRTRRNLADCAVVVEELWWKALDFASLKRSSVSFFHDDKHETAISRWARARTRAAKVGKGLSKSDKAQKLALQHWLEAIDPRHRYGHNLHFYYDVWFTCENTQPFFYWLDVGEGKEVNLEICPRNTLQSQCVQYLGPNERLEYEVVVEDGKLVYKKSGELVNTNKGSKWIFVLSTSGNLYVGKKKKGKFQHSSFLSGGAIMGAGRLIVKEGILEVIWPYSGHYLPTEENFQEFIKYLGKNGVDLTNVKRCAVNQDESQSFRNLDYMPIKPEEKDIPYESDNEEEQTSYTKNLTIPRLDLEFITDKSFTAETEERLSCNWSTGAGPRIGCVRDYPSSLQCEALEQVSLSPRVDNSRGLMSLKLPIPSPRPGSGIRLSPRLAYMGCPSSSPTVSLTLPEFS